MKQILNKLKNKISYKRLAIANWLNYAAVRLIQITQRCCCKLIRLSLYLDPNRTVFKKELFNLECYGAHVCYYKQHIQFYAVQDGVRILTQKIRYFERSRTIKLSMPKIINKDFVLPKEYECEPTLPNTYLAELNNATVFSGTDLVIVKNIALYDEIDITNLHSYHLKTPIIEKIFKNTLILKIPNILDKDIQSGIHFCKDHSNNYFHWIIECLPRLSLIKQIDQNVPLLIDSDVYPQSLEALNLLNIDNRPLIKLEKNKSYIVKKLYYPSQLSVLKDNYDLPNYQKDALYSATAVNFVRNSVLKSLNISPKMPNRKLYISRRLSGYRKLLNSTEIENFLVTQGFEIVHPENLSFYAQVQIFSEAKIIIGQSGAGMANFIFAPTECKILMLLSNVPQANMHLFHSLARSINLNIEFLIGNATILLPTPHRHQSDFYVNIELIHNYLHNNDNRQKY